MTLKNDLLASGYFPDNLPPPFYTSEIAKFFAEHPSSYLCTPKSPFRSTGYSVSKRGNSRRTFSVIHPVIAHDLAEFLQLRGQELDALFQDPQPSLSIPKHTPDGRRAIEIASHGELEAARLDRLSGCRFVAKTDISRFYHSIYTHSVPWAFHGKEKAKSDRKYDSTDVYFNRLDFILRQSQDGQTIGIPVGPDASRYIAELVSTAIDRRFAELCSAEEIVFIRHVDDIWIGAQSHAEAERALWLYRTCLKDFELDINEAKTQIFAANFRFTDPWPSNVATRLELAISSAETRREERLRSALEYAFELALDQNDDGILKYAIRQLDKSQHDWDEWKTLEPFLKRSAVHFGHTIDYVVRVLVWRKLAHGDLNVERWGSIIHAMLNRHGELGNDSEVCWLLFATKVLELKLPDPIALQVVRNCGPMPLVAILNAIDSGTEAFSTLFERVSQESGEGPMWPVIFDWASSGFDKYAEIKKTIQNETMLAMCDDYVTLFDPGLLTSVFEGVEPSKYNSVGQAIETGGSFYDI